MKRILLAVGTALFITAIGGVVIAQPVIAEMKLKFYENLIEVLYDVTPGTVGDTVVVTIDGDDSRVTVGGVTRFCDGVAGCPTANVATAAGEMLVEGDVETDGNLNVAGTATITGASTLTGATTITGDLDIDGGAGALDLTGSGDSSVLLADNDTTAVLFGSTGQLNLLTLDTGDDTETVIVTGTTATDALHVDVGQALFDELVTMGAAATVGTTLGVTGLSTFTGGWTAGLNAITGADSLVAADCGRITTITAGADGLEIVLPEASTVIGCTFELVYIGADAGALIDITPLDSDADGIEGSCVLAASVVTFSGTADADIGLTKASILTGDGLKLTAVSATMWWAHDITGICANN